MWMVLASAAACLAVFVFFAYRRGWAWTGFREKSLWDWLSLLIVPVGLALVLFLLDDAQSRRERDRAEANAQRTSRAEADRRRATLLSEYLQRMSDLILSHELMKTRGDAPVAQLATTLTLTVLGQLDARRKGQVLLFLDRARLLDPTEPHMELNGADFSHLDAHDLHFPWAMGLRGADFRGANFDGASIQGNPRGGRFARPTPSILYANFDGASLRNARLANVELGPSNLRRADFTGAYLSGSHLEGCLSGARFHGAELRDVTFDGVRGDAADFRKAVLSGTSLQLAYPEADPAVLTGARFDGAKLGKFRVPPSWTREGAKPVRC